MEWVRLIPNQSKQFPVYTHTSFHNASACRQITSNNSWEKNENRNRRNTHFNTSPTSNQPYQIAPTDKNAKRMLGSSNTPDNPSVQAHSNCLQTRAVNYLLWLTSPPGSHWPQPQSVDISLSFSRVSYLEPSPHQGRSFFNEQQNWNGREKKIIKTWEDKFGYDTVGEEKDII